MAATSENPIVFYDLASKPGQYWSFNTFKTRLTLSYKGLPYRVQYIRFHEIEPTMKALGMAPISVSIPRYTLPIIADPSSDPNGKPTFVSDSFNIAMYLDNKYPAPKYPTVLPIAARPLQKIFIERYFPSTTRSLFESFINPVAVHKFLDDEERESAFQRFGADRFKLPTEEEFGQKLVEVREKWNELGQALELSSHDGPFVMGNTVTLADFAIGGVLDALYKTQGDSGAWRELMAWQDGRWAKLWKEIQAVEKKTPEIS